MTRLLAWLAASVLATAILAPFLLFGVYTFGIYERALLPQYEERADVVASGIERRLSLGLRLFGELSALRDIDEILANAADNSPQTAFLVVTDAAGQVIAQDPPVVANFQQMILVTDDSGGSGLNKLIETRVERAFDLIFPAPPEAEEGWSHIYESYLISRRPIGDAADPAGYVYLGTDTTLLDSLRRDLSLNMLIVFAAAMLLGFECLLLIAGVSLLRPLTALRFLQQQLSDGDLRHTARASGPFGTAELIRQTNRFIRNTITRAAAQGGSITGLSLPGSGHPTLWRAPVAHLIRLPLILFFLSEAILRPSLPLFLQGILPVGQGGQDLQVGLAMAAFLLASLIGIVVGARFCNRARVKRVILLGVVVSALGTFGHVIVATVAEAALFRGVAGLGYGIVYAAAQVYIVEHSDRRRRTTGFSLFFIAVVGADIVGPAIGGILADRLGVDAAFYMATTALALSFMTTLGILPSEKPLPKPPRPSFRESLHPTGAILRNRRYIGLIFGMAIPAKLLLNGGLFLCLPLAVASLGGGAAAAGQLFMIYGLVVLLSASLIARAIDRWNLVAPVVCIGTIMSALALALPELVGSSWALVPCVAIFAFGQALSVPSQMSFLLHLTPSEQTRFGAATVIGQYRFMERLGSLAGPIIGAALLTILTPTQSLLCLGLVAMLLAGLASTYFLIVGECDEEEAIDALLVRT
ncbi:MFS transporter [Pseudooceanicola algae]|uniref:Major facilitator superfamily (MFS) profile domain-containing protein n=1 Tax=Pseudooceanicola algae TaxID=1537215 RepID=A0A418SHR5_9RHOB|nr:MFS transporter [Pseudooceanicola algae]QPM90248.1 hypothetical protein PSAL_014830 [Pseudooceanicola algae]